MPFKTVTLAFMASLAAHTLLVSLYPPAWENGEPDDHFVEVSYVHVDKETPPALPPIKYPPAVKDQVRARAPKPEAIQVSRQEGTAPVVSKSVNSFKVSNSEELLADPQKGKIFLDYFGLIKQRVRRAVEKRYPGERLGRGDVSLIFVLKSDGAVVNVFTVEKGSSADELMTDFAVRCVKDCSPFPHFPKALGMDRISFNLSILFDET